MACQNICKLCPRLVISTAVAYDATTNTLNITIPNNGYRNGEKVCIIVAQNIPAATTINANVFIFVDGSSFPLTRCNCSPATACEIRTRTKYSTVVVTNNTIGTFRLLGKTCCQAPEALAALPVAPVAAATTQGGEDNG